MLVGLALAFAIARGVVLSFLAQRVWLSDTTYLFGHAINAVDLGFVPYREVPVEYPPLSWWLAELPRVLDSTRYTAADLASPEVQERALAAYRMVFRGEMAVLDAGAFAFLVAWGWRRGALWVAGAYVLVTEILWHLLYDRLDVGLTMLLAACAYTYGHAAVATTARRRDAWAAAAMLGLGLGVSFKLIPIVVAPLLLLAEWRCESGDGRARRLAGGAAALVCGAVVPFLLEAPVAGSATLSILGLHAERDIQVESIWATLLYAAAAFGIKVRCVHSHGGWNLAGPLEPAFKIASTVAMTALFAVTGTHAVRERERFGRERAMVVAMFVLVATTAVSRVTSPQYFLWALPALLLGAAATNTADASTRRSTIAIVALAAVVAALTTWVFPYHYLRSVSKVALVPDLAPAAQAAVAARNVAFAAAVALLGARVYARRRSTRS